MNIGISTTDLAYIAGIIDGEGNIGITKKTNTCKGEKNIAYNVFVRVSNTDKRLLQYLKKTIGNGSICLDKRKGNRRNCYNWRISSNKCLNLLEAVAPYMIIKKEQVKVVQKFRTTFNKVYSRNGLPKKVIKTREECYSKLIALHHREF